MKHKIELLAPGGDVGSVKAAILAGANAVYCGLNKFNARNRAENIGFDELQGLIRLAHTHNCEIFLTLNVVILDSEIPALIKLLNRLVNTAIDGVIIQDLGIFYLLSHYFTSLKIHASTQLTTHNEGQIRFLSMLNAERVNLSRELNINEIAALSQVAHQNKLLTEVFVHGSYCISFSGICYMSSVHGGNSGNRGRCSQPCRDKYVKTPASKNYPLNLKDNSAYFDLRKLSEAGVDSLKIEGRIKEFDYVYTVVKSWREQLNGFSNNNRLSADNSELYKVFNRDFNNSFLRGNISKEMFIDNPMSHATKHLLELNKYASDDEMLKAQAELYSEKEVLRTSIKNKIDRYNIAKLPVTISVLGERGAALKILVKTPNTSFEVRSEVNLTDVGVEALSHKTLLKRLKAINDTEYYIEQLFFEIDSELYLPFKELTVVKKKLLFVLNGSRKVFAPLQIPALKKQRKPTTKPETKPTLSVLISSIKDVAVCNKTTADVYFQLPSSFKDETGAFLELFRENKQLTPWFPSVLIGEDFVAAVEFVHELKPVRLVTNNSGIAFEAYEKGIEWIAGPFLNITNSYSLLTLKERFNCYGAFLSNEMSKTQILSVKKPADFKLYFSIYHPLVLMTSRQCLFHQVTGCSKSILDGSCIRQCEKSSSITNIKQETSFIQKTKGNYHSVYNAANMLNTNIVSDMPGRFSSLFIDLREVQTQTTVHMGKIELTGLFDRFIGGESDLAQQIKQLVQPTNNTQYMNGI